MSDRFKQTRVEFSGHQSEGVLKVSKLMELVDDHPYLAEIEKAFNIKSMAKDVIVVENIDTLFKRIARLKKDYVFYNIEVNGKDVSFTRGRTPVEGISDQQPLEFNISEYVDSEGEIHGQLTAYALYDARSKFFDDFSMSKYATMLFDHNFDQLAEMNLTYFRNLAKSRSDFNKHRRYRVVVNNGERFVRGITSRNYKEFGVGLTFVVTMLMLHKHMKHNKGNNYRISFAAVSESKLELTITTDVSKNAGDFGKVRSAISVKTNDLGNGALSITNIVRLDVKGEGVYLYPANKEVAKKDITINHGNTSAKTALKQLAEADDFYNYIDLFVSELKSIKTIRTPEDLRKRILLKFEHHNSLLKPVKGKLTPLFSTALSNDIKDFAKLLEMCRKAEELDIDYDLKDKLRVVISDIILNKN